MNRKRIPPVLHAMAPITLLYFVFLVVFSVGCSPGVNAASGAGALDGAAPTVAETDAAPIDPPTAFSLHFAPGEVAPGDEGVHCLDVAGPTTDTWVSGWRVTKTGVHHVNLWLRKPGGATAPWTTPTACAGGWGRGPFVLDSSKPTVLEELPAGVAMLIPAGSSIIFDVHFLNVSDAPVPEDVDVTFFDGTDHQTVASGTQWFPGGTKLDLAPGATKTFTYSPTLPLHADNILVSLMGHEHSHGTTQTITVDGAEVYRSDNWAEPPLLHPMVHVGPTSVIKVSCTYENTTSATIQWGPSVTTSEMCNVFGVSTGPHWESGVAR